MRKDRISLALTKEIIRKLDEASKEARRSRSDYAQLVLEAHFQSNVKSKERATTEIKPEITFKMG